MYIYSINIFQSSFINVVHSRYCRWKERIYII